MMMILGMFPFALQTTPYQTSNQANTWRHVKNDRVGKSPRYQYIGPDEEPITLSGTLYPEISGGDVSLITLETMAYTGRAWPLIEGTGRIYGMYVIDGLTQNRSEFFQDGKARKIDFTLSLKKVSEDIREKLAEITNDDVLGMVKAGVNF
ncbi:phage tail protein [Hafnia psychrotolerans]|uniref:Tail assembly protein n=1 Tax=Hafnia psychrotolerans TaxID=1477018 RepID=A0ABQ1GDS9_9GAMM|nr:phage tail protein [Hafnia psychrotolerans]GGA41904.1 tail assembly protein [Hafnia psychrotolerans]